MRLRRSDEQRRFAAPQRAAKVDANPHQIDAVIFALARLREGGCILADEVGLGKTIEAGLVIAQLMAEGARRVLLITPKPLLGQWRQELYQLFNIDAVEARAGIGGFDGEGVFLIGREAAGSARGRDALLLSEEFDLAVIDEAHEVFAGVHKRFDRLGQYNEDATTAQTAGRVREVLAASRTPVLLLTATPIQNSLAELWGLVQYVDPLGTLLGDLATFREVFCNADDRQVAQGQEDELRSRLRSVLQRTLRRDAQLFLEKPFVGREARLFEYVMAPEEKALYNDVTQYLLEPGILAFEGRHRQLLLLSFHRLMASSNAALAASLQGVAKRLGRMLERTLEAGVKGEDVDTLLADLEEDDAGSDDSAPEHDQGAAPSPAEIRAELDRVEGYIERAKKLGAEDSKFRALLQALRFVAERHSGSGKMVIFTESRVTQADLCARLIASGLVRESEITLFSGTNDGERAREALTRWTEEVPRDAGQKLNPDIATRLALVHEFRTRSRVFISTEAGAKGLNLQFCDTVVNYDLPWNPQRIEQRIGRCHRYGQQRGVTVINFLAKDNLTQVLTFEILSQKLELFGTVLDASDQVLHRAATNSRGEVLVSVLGGEFESELRRIYDRALTLDEVTAELRALRDKVAEERKRFEEAHARTHDLIEKRLEEGIQRVFRQHKERVPGALAELDRDLYAVVTSFLDAAGIAHERKQVGEEELLHVAPSLLLPEGLREGAIAAVGLSKEHQPLYVGHPLVQAAVAASRDMPSRVSAVVSLSDSADEELAALAGQRGCLRLVKVAFDGFEKVELLVPVFVSDSGQTIPPHVAQKLLQAPMRDGSAPQAVNVDEDALSDAEQEVMFAVQAEVDADEQKRFERASLQAERYIEDRVLVLKRRRRGLEDRLEQARGRRDGATGSEARSDAERAVLSVETDLAEVNGGIHRLENRDDATFQQYQQHIHRRRYTPPRVERLFDLDVVIE